MIIMKTMSPVQILVSAGSAGFGIVSWAEPLNWPQRQNRAALKVRIAGKTT